MSDEGLFAMARVEPPERPKVPVDKTFRGGDRHQQFLLPPSLDEWLPADHLARFVADLVDEHLDVSRICADYTARRGAPPYEPRLMVRLLLYGYATGVRSSRQLERKSVDEVAFRWLAAGSAPDFRSIARFRRRHLKALAWLFFEVLRLCQAAGMVRLGVVALDGTKVRANASRRKAMSHARLTDKEKVLAGEVDALLADAERTDQDEDRKFGPGRRGDELPEELRRRETRLAAIRRAKQQIEQETTAAAAAQAERRAREHGADDEQAAQTAAQAAAKATPKPSEQRNFTDPDARIMKTSDGSFHYCYNAQAVVDAEHQIIVAADVTQQASDVAQLLPMVVAAVDNCDLVPTTVLADAGYCSTDNLRKTAELEDLVDITFCVATGRLCHGEQVPPAPRGRIPKNATPRERMARRLRTKRGRASYARRKTIVEPVFGQMATLPHAKQLLLRGRDGAHGEWLLPAATHNLRKLFGHLDAAGLQTLPAG